MRFEEAYEGWNVKHYYAGYKREGGSRRYTWVKNTLQQAGVVKKVHKRGVHRNRRERTPWPGMMLHQDDSQHPWVAGPYWNLIVFTGLQRRVHPATTRTRIGLRRLQGHPGRCALRTV